VAWRLVLCARRGVVAGARISRVHATLTGLGERAHLADLDISLHTHITDIVNVLKYEDLHDVVLCGTRMAAW